LLRSLKFEVCAFDCTIRAATSSPQAFAVLSRYIFPPLPRITGAVVQPDILICLDEIGEEFQLLVNGEVMASAGRPESLAAHVVHFLDEAVVKRLTGLCAVHSGAVQWNGRALLLPGATHSGKSSLVAELLRRGATCFSDEFALIDTEGRVHPYPRPLLLRDGGPRQFPLLPEELNASFADAPAPIGWILALEYQSAESWNIAPVPQGFALMTLLRNTPHPLAEVPGMMQAFQRAVAGAACFAGRRHDAVQAADRILVLLGGQP